ncbi:MAG: hypothetical protein ACTHN5_09425 [Phycisphaerae bacterium]
MRFSTSLSELSLSNLRAIARGSLPCAISDADFLQTLSAHKCFILYPWIVRAQPDGQLARVSRLAYDNRGNLDKIRILLAVARALRKPNPDNLPFGGRFSS